MASGVCYVYVPHTTAAIMINECADPDVASDLEGAFDRLIPFDTGRTDTAEGNSDSHMKVCAGWREPDDFCGRRKVEIARPLAGFVFLRVRWTARSPLSSEVSSLTRPEIPLPAQHPRPAPCAVAVLKFSVKMSSLGIYVQVPFCQTKCTYCNFHTGVVSSSRFAPYVSAVCREIQYTLSRLRAPVSNSFRPANAAKVDTVYFGGGTPSLLAPRHLQIILDTIRESSGLRSAPKSRLRPTPKPSSRGKASAWAQRGNQSRQFWRAIVF